MSIKLTQGSYTLAVGKAPFHAAKREEIYKKLQNREYEWPDLSKHQNDISNNLRDLVGSLLVDEDDRPNPDMIVSHPFFKMAFIPEILDSSCKAVKPAWSSIRPPTPEVIRRGYSESWWKLCKASGVGEFAKGRCFPVVGAATITSVVKDVEREIKANLAPTVPITAGTVYLPFVSDRKDRSQRGSENLSEIAEERESSADSAQLVEISGNDRKPRQPKAASLKSQPVKFKENVAPTSPRSDNQPDPGSIAIRRARSTKGRMEGSRRVISRDIPVSQTQRAPSDPAKPTVRSALIIERPQQPETQQRQPLPRSNSTVRKKTTSQDDQDIVEDQLARPMANLILERPVRPRATRPISQITQEGPRKPEKAEISRQERPVPLPSRGKDAVLPFTDPTTVLARATQLRDNLLAAVSAKERNLKMKKQFRQLPFVSKWVDYSKKHGIGYVLADGSIGCVFNANNRQPVTHVVVRNGHSHLRKPGNDNIAISQIPLEFYSDGTTDAIKIIPMEGDRRRLNGILWAKFGNYMCQTLSNSPKRKEDADSSEETKLIVRYYQRLGTVGVWGFSDGCFQVCSGNLEKRNLFADIVQFNFPDHTKLVLAADGKYCSFTCLPVDAMDHMKKNGDLPLKFMKHREVLSGPVQCLLNAGGRSDMMRANLLEEKVQFIAGVANLWVEGGGLGCRPTDVEWPRWPGPHLEDAGGKKVDWITVGRFGGDLERV